MSNHGTAYTFGQYNEVLTAVIKSMPRAIAGTDPKLIIAGLQNRNEELGMALHDALIKIATPPQYPADGVEFELTFDFDAPEADPIAMVRDDGFSSPEKWRFTGQKLSGIQTRRFKLVWVGACSDLDEVRAKLAQYGEIPAGQWREAFKAAFPKFDGNGPIGFADPSWVGPDGSVHFPFVFSDGDSYFNWAGHGHGEFWRWLVPASK